MNRPASEQQAAAQKVEKPLAQNSQNPSAGPANYDSTNAENPKPGAQIQAAAGKAEPPESKPGQTDGPVGATVGVVSNEDRFTAENRKEVANGSISNSANQPSVNAANSNSNTTPLLLLRPKRPMMNAVEKPQTKSQAM